MTLATVPRYDPDRVSEIGDHAVVIGASMAGLCAARVLADAFESVTVVERDSLDDEPVVRRGVPQSEHIHVLQEAGRVTLEDLFPGFSERLLGAGGLLIDASRDVRFYMEGGFLADGRRRHTFYSATRPLYEQIIRRCTTDLDAIELRSNCRFTEYLLDDSGTTVTGVEVETGGGTGEELTADLVVDATGRTSRTPDWLDRNGYAAPTVEEVHIDVTYSTTTLERPAGDRRAFLVVPSPEQPRGGAVVPVEDGRWLMTLWGMHGEQPPDDPDAYVDFAADLPVPHLKQLLDAQSRLDGPIVRYPFPSNRRCRYEDLDRFPDGLVVVGDAVASFNPIYGQGMSVASLEAVILHHTLAAGSEDIPVRFFDRASDTVDVAWNMAVGGDHQFPQTRGPKPRGTDALNWYLSRLLQRAHSDRALFDAFFEVQTMVNPPTSLLHPSIVWRVFKPTG